MSTNLLIILANTAAIVLVWFLGKIKTRREKRNSDLELIDRSILPLLDSIDKLTAQNNEVVAKLLAEQNKNLLLVQEKSELLVKIDKLEKQINVLNKKVNELIRQA
jgi:hypothetical protein